MLEKPGDWEVRQGHGRILGWWVDSEGEIKEERFFTARGAKGAMRRRGRNAYRGAVQPVIAEGRESDPAPTPPRPSAFTGTVRP